MSTDASGSETTANPIITDASGSVVGEVNNQLVVRVRDTGSNTDGPRNFNYRQMDNTIQNMYFYECDNNSTICDVIALYLMGQKILYIEAKTYCEQHLNFLMLPAIFITAVCSILSLVLKDSYYGPIIVSSLNGVNVFLLAVVNYLKLDARSEAHRTTSYKFDKVQSNLVFTSGKMLFMKESHDNIKKIIEDTEKDVREIKETNQFILPEWIRLSYPKLCTINVFAEVKKINNREIMIVNRIKDIYNDIQQVKFRIDKAKISNEDSTEDSRVLKELEEKHRHCIESFIRLKDDYLKIDDIFEEEMRINRERKKRRWCTLCQWLKN